MISPDDAEKERFAVNKEGELSTCDGKRGSASTGGRNDLAEEKWKAG